jgi:hypothetical protein
MFPKQTVKTWIMGGQDNAPRNELIEAGVCMVRCNTVATQQFARHCQRKFSLAHILGCILSFLVVGVLRRARPIKDGTIHRRVACTDLK